VTPAETIPLPDGSVDVAMSAFVLQLVHDRASVLRELHRVLRPGGRLAAVTWLESVDRLPADDEFDEAVIDLGIDEPEAEAEEREDDFESPDAAERELVSAGFAHARAEPGELRHAWSRSGYLRFKEEYDEQHLFGSLDRPARDALVARVTERWAALPDEAFLFRHPIVSMLATRP
jgi:SAM-dependent methyltransferase